MVVAVGGAAKAAPAVVDEDEGEGEEENGEGGGREGNEWGEAAWGVMGSAGVGWGGGDGGEVDGDGGEGGECWRCRRRRRRRGVDREKWWGRRGWGRRGKVVIRGWDVKEGKEWVVEGAAGDAGGYKGWGGEYQEEEGEGEHFGYLVSAPCLARRRRSEE